MKRFEVNFPVNGQDVSLFVESMDDTHTRFSIEREVNDPHPLLIELSSENVWKMISQDAWQLTEEEINKLGRKINEQCDSSEHVYTGINAT